MLPVGVAVVVEVLPRKGDKGISDCSIFTGTYPGIKDLSGDLLRFIFSLGPGGLEGVLVGVGITSSSKLLLRLSYNFRLLEGDRGGTRSNLDIN